MTRLVATSDSSAAGNLKQADLADIAIPVDRRLVWGPLPSETELAAFFEARTNQEPDDHWLDFGQAWPLEKFGINDLGFLEVCARCETVELWFDPQPNDQLMLLWLLDYLHTHAKPVPSLSLRLVDFRIGYHNEKRLAKYKVPAVEITRDHLEVASVAWQAYRAPTPEAWFNLLKRDLSLVPQLGPCVLELLEELPGSATGLGATEMRMLELCYRQVTRARLTSFPATGSPANGVCSATGKSDPCSMGSLIVRHPPCPGSTRGRSHWRCTMAPIVSSNTNAAS